MPKRRSSVSIDWFYQRPNCESCDLARAWLEQAGVKAAETVNCRKEPLDAEKAIQLARSLQTLIATRGSKVVRVDLKKDRLTDAELRALVVGPSGKLRAPSLRHGQTLIVGFNAAVYADVLG
jgi:arsenate reductase-like glutaredoxin family protein